MDDLATTYEAEYPVIVRFAEGMLAGNGDGHDIAQEAFLRLRKSDVPAGRIRFWLLRVARNLALNELRRRRRLERIRPLFPWIGREEDPYETASQKENTRRLHACLNLLPPGLRAPLLLREWESMTYDEIAISLDISLAKVKSNLHRARQRLREAMNRGES
jgi:RNA polymerase sigma-70 factor (ECF subfamily)